MLAPLRPDGITTFRCRLIITPHAFSLPFFPLAGELRYQEAASVSSGWPPVLLAKGPEVAFTAGAPLQVDATPLPGYQMLPGRSLFVFGSYNCSGSLRWVQCSLPALVQPRWPPACLWQCRWPRQPEVGQPGLAHSPMGCPWAVLSACMRAWPTQSQALGHRCQIPHAAAPADSVCVQG